jgi:hypothetical protein
MIIWRGRGFAIALIAFGSLVLAEGAIEEAFQDTRYYQQHGWPKLLGFWTAATLVYAVRSWLGVPTPHAVADGKAGRVPEGELFFVKARFWPAVLVCLGIVFLFVKD